jgi:hypothetical protein
VINLGSRERHRRLALGVAMLAVGFGIAAALILTDANPWWRISLVLPFWASALGFFQAQEST